MGGPVQGVENAIRSVSGMRGSYVVDDTSTHDYSTAEGKWTHIHIIADSQFADLDDELLSTRSTSNLESTGTTIAQGAVLAGSYTKVRLRSGKAILYV